MPEETSVVDGCAVSVDRKAEENLVVVQAGVRQHRDAEDRVNTTAPPVVARSDVVSD